MSDFLHMGGYAFFVWSAYALTFIVMLAIFLWPIIERRAVIQQLLKTFKRQEQLARRKNLSDN